MEERVLVECRGGPWDGRYISDRGPVFHVTAALKYDGLLQPNSWSPGLYERRPIGYYWIPLQSRNEK